MDEMRFAELADAYGGILARWPDPVRGLAQAWLDAHPDAGEAILAEARALDQVLGTAPEPQVSPALRARIVADAERVARGGPRDAAKPSWWPDFAGGFGGLAAGTGALRWAPAAASLMVVLTLGVGAGVWGGNMVVDQAVAEDIVSLAFTQTSSFTTVEG